MSLEEAVALAAKPVPQTPPPRSVGETAELASELTVREVEVLRLVGQGLTNAEIAETLIVSPFTVNAHLRSIYQKLGVTSRRAAVRAVTEKRLV